MKVLFSEYKSDYTNYIFPYAIWALPEGDETPADLFEKGFLPNKPDLSRFYLCRQVRVGLKDFTPSSENRRVLRKGEGVSYRLVGRRDFEFTPEWREFCKSYADARFGQDVMSYARLDALMNSPVVSHVMIFTDDESGRDVGIVFLYLQPQRLAFYYYSFFDLDFPRKNLGMYLMTSAVRYFHEQGYDYIYLGSCYSRNALYKTQFEGVQFFNGVRWSSDLAELKYLIDRDGGEVNRHLLETGEYLEQFYPKSF